MSDKIFPKPEDIQKEFEDFVQKRFGGQVHVITQEIPSSQLSKRKQKKDDPQHEHFELKFDLKPKDIKTYLDRFVIKQDEAKKALSIAVCDHYNQVIHHLSHPDDKSQENYAKQNILILGPTGVGKTYMIKQIAKLIGVPFVKADATRFSETGYIGANVDDLVKDLVAQAEGNIRKAQYGIIYLDEGDKLATPPNAMGRDVSGRGVQLGLLKLMEETEVDLKANHDPASQMQAFLEMQQKGRIERQVINTKHILFIVSGAFTGLADIISKRLHKNHIGFLSQNHNHQIDDEAFPLVITQDFIDFGFEPEFVGRLPIRVACHHLDKDSLFSILNSSEGSIIRQYKFAFHSYGIEAHFTPEALQAIASLAAQEKTGARALMTILERILRDYKFELPSTHLMELIITAEVILNPKKELQKILQNINCEQQLDIDSIHLFEEDFLRKHAIKIVFDRSAIRYICSEAKKMDVSTNDMCASLLQSYEHGLKLIQQNTNQTNFLITEETVRHPKITLEKMVKDSYNSKDTIQKDI